MPPKAAPQRGPLGPWHGVGGVDSFAHSSYAAAANAGHGGVAQQFNTVADQLLTRTLPGQADAVVPALQHALGGNQPAWQHVNVNNYKIWFILDLAVADKIIELYSRLPVRTITSLRILFPDYA
jgi:hypothetical protein